MPAAARISDMHTCPDVEPGPVPHVGGPVIAGEATVLVGYQPAARVGDQATCTGPVDKIQSGEPTVQIGNADAARQGDPTEHGGVILGGCATVLIGSSAQASALVGAAEKGTPLCEECAAEDP